MQVLIREGQLKDAPSIAQFQQQMAWETENKRLNAEVVLTAVESVFRDLSKGFYLVAEVDNRVIGSLLITFEWSDWRNCNMWYIQSVYVDSEFRGQGVFTSLYQRVVQMASIFGRIKSGI